MLYLIVQDKDIYPVNFDSRSDFKHFCDEWILLSKYDKMVIEISFHDKLRSEIIWRAGEGWL